MAKTAEKIMFEDEELTLRQICEKHNVNLNTVNSRLKRGWTLKDAIYTPARRERDSRKEDYVSTSKRCRKCVYRASSGNSSLYTCDYIIATGESRGCKVRNCNKFKLAKKGGAE